MVTLTFCLLQQLHRFTFPPAVYEGSRTFLHVLTNTCYSLFFFCLFVVVEVVEGEKNQGRLCEGNWTWLGLNTYPVCQQTNRHSKKQGLVKQPDGCRSFICFIFFLIAYSFHRYLLSQALFFVRDLWPGSWLRLSQPGKLSEQAHHICCLCSPTSVLFWTSEVWLLPKPWLLPR